MNVIISASYFEGTNYRSLMNYDRTYFVISDIKQARQVTKYCYEQKENINGIILRNGIENSAEMYAVFQEIYLFKNDHINHEDAIKFMEIIDKSFPNLKTL